MQVVAKSVDYSKNELSGSNYFWQSYFPIDGVSTVNVDSSGGQETQFQIPSAVFNFAESNINFLFTPDAHGSSLYNCLRADFVPFWRSIEVWCVNGTQKLLSLSNADLANATMFRAETSYSEMTSRIPYWANATDPVHMGYQNSYDNTVIKVPNLANASANYRMNGMNCIIAGGLNTATPVIKVRVPLSSFKNTILALDKSIFLNDQLIIKFVWNSKDRMIFASPSTTDLLTSTAVYGGSKIAMSALELSIAVEKNQNVIAALMNQTKSQGYSVLFDSTQVVVRNIAAADTNIIAEVSAAAGFGRKLKKCFHSIFWPTFTGSTLYTRPSSYVANYYQLLLNGQPLTNYLTPSQYYSNYFHEFEGSSYTSYQEWAAHAVFGFNFTGKPGLWRVDQNEDAGLPLDAPQQLSFVTQNNSTAENHTHVVCLVGQKLLTVGPAGVAIY